MISNDIPKTDKSLVERGLPEDSFFDVFFSDGSWASEQWMNWSAISEERRVQYFGGTKTVFVCKLPVRSLYVCFGSLEANIEVPEGHDVFQAIRSETVLVGNRKVTRVLGRVVGLIKDGEVVEEQFLNGVQNEVVGRRI